MENGLTPGISMDGLYTVADDDENILKYPKKLSHFILCGTIILHYLFNVLLNNRFCITVLLLAILL
jgi:hypothetical protein